MNAKTNFRNWSSLRLNRHRTEQACTLLPLLLCLAVLTSPAQTYTILHCFGSASDGSGPAASLVQGADGTLYGTTTGGGALGYGIVFKVSTNGSAYAVLHDFTGADGSNPGAALVLSGTTLYGSASQIPNRRSGTLFKLNVDGSGFTVLKQYNNADGAMPGGLLVSGATLYGTTEYTDSEGAAVYGDGTVFRVNTDGSGYTVLRYFSGIDGSRPYGALLLDGATLYGATRNGGPVWGTLFRMNTDGTGFALLTSFGRTNGSDPCGSLMLSGTTLYGTTSFDGEVPPGAGKSWGTVFKVNTDGSGFSLLKSFYTNDGAWPSAGVLLAGDRLYGTTQFTTNRGGPMPPNGAGTIFTIKTDGTGFMVLKYFSDADGRSPRGSLLLAGDTLYGTAHDNGGVVFSLSVVPPVIEASPEPQTAEIGSPLNLFARAHGSQPLTYLWFFNQTNLLSATTDSALQLTNVQLANAGTYIVVVTNWLGAATSSPAMVSVIDSVPRRMVPALTLMGQMESFLNLDSRTTLDSSTSWETFDTLPVTNASQLYFDLTAPLAPQRFYRAWQTNALSPPSVRDVHFVPAITITGALSSSVRVDRINQFGPIDAWVTLDTVTLTSSPQLYFDTSSIGQPARLWRIVPVP